MVNTFVVFLVIGASIGFYKANVVAATDESSPCGDWTPYKDEKCFKVASKAGHQTKEDAETVCASFKEELRTESSPRLIMVKTKDEQEFLRDFLFADIELVDNVWLGMRKVENSTAFLWNDGSDVYFTNWIDQEDDDHHQCVQMASGEDTNEVGQWIKVNCKKATTVVCERTQPWTTEKLQGSFLNYKLDQEQLVKSLRNEIADMKRNPVPIGFIYVQLPFQKTPQQVWSDARIEWQDVSRDKNYESFFFRVDGKNSAPFEKIQDPSTNRLYQVENNGGQSNTSPLTIPADGSWSGYIYNGHNGGSADYLRFRLSNEEVCPRNIAIKLWKRVK